MPSSLAALAAVVGVILAACQPIASPPPGPPANLNDVFFLPDGEVGWAVGDFGTVLHTTDGGGTWLRQAAPFGEHERARQVAAPDLLSVHFLSDRRRGWAVGSDGVILATSDGGHSWNLELSYVGIVLRAVQFLEDGRRGWVVGGNGYILATADGSQRWERQPSGTWAKLHGVQFLDDGLRGWAVGVDGLITETSDGGQTWRPQTRRTRAELTAIRFLPDGLRGWVLGLGAIMATSDGGQSWRLQPVAAGTLLVALDVLADGRRGWAVGYHGTIIATTDGGRTWEPQASGTRASLGAVQFLEDGRRGGRWARAVRSSRPRMGARPGGRRPSRPAAEQPAFWPGLKGGERWRVVSVRRRAPCSG